METKQIIKELERKFKLKKYSSMTHTPFNVIERTNENDLTLVFNLVGRYKIYDINKLINISVIRKQFRLWNKGTDEVFSNLDSLIKYMFVGFSKIIYEKSLKLEIRYKKVTSVKRAIKDLKNLVIDPDKYTNEELDYMWDFGEEDKTEIIKFYDNEGGEYPLVEIKKEGLEEFHNVLKSCQKGDTYSFEEFSKIVIKNSWFICWINHAEEVYF